MEDIPNDLATNENVDLMKNKIQKISPSASVVQESELCPESKLKNKADPKLIQRTSIRKQASQPQSQTRFKEQTKVISSKRETRQSAAKLGMQVPPTSSQSKIETNAAAEGKKAPRASKNHSRQKSKGAKFDNKENAAPLNLKNEDQKKTGLRQS